MEVKISIEQVHIHIDGSTLPTQQVPADWKEILLQAVRETNHVTLHHSDSIQFAPDAKIIAPKLNKSASGAKKLTKKERKKNFVFGVTPKKQCQKCAKDFQPKSNGQKYCADCSSNKSNPDSKQSITTDPVELSSQGRPMNTCKECGQKFEPVKSPLEKFCSPLCKKYYTTKYNREWYQKKAKKSETIVPKKETSVPKIETVVPKIEKPIRYIPSGMSGQELMDLKKVKKQ